ncbi:MAG: AMP-binding protein, partial [Actinomycetota bacterium]
RRSPSVSAVHVSGVIGTVGRPTGLGARDLDEALDRLDPVLVLSSPGLPTPVGRPTVPITPDTWTALTDGDRRPPTGRRAQDPSLVVFTSGSSGVPKGVVHTGGSLAVKAEQLVGVHDLGPEDAVLVPAPLAHVSGLLHGVLMPAVGGVRAVLQARWDPGEALDLIEAERVTYMVGPPTFFTDLMDHRAFAPSRTATLRFVSCGGTDVTPAFVARAADRLGCAVKRSYGSTEAPTITTSRNDDPPDRMAETDGRPHGPTRVRIGGPSSGGDAPVDGTEGEVWASGPELAAGYLDDAATEERFVDGWFRTGDLGRLDEGWLTITGRAGDHIIRGGENVSPAAVADVLERHPSVRESVVVGVPHERLGEQVGAVVVADSGFDLAESTRWFRAEQVGPLLIPEQVVVTDAIPRLASGKPDRAAALRILQAALDT